MEEFIIKVLKVIYEADIHSDLTWSFDANDKLSFQINCSDVFYWGGSDFEELTPENLHVLEESIRDVNEACGNDHANYAAELFCSRIRKMRPQGAAYPSNSLLWPLIDVCGEYREPGMGNPEDHPSKTKSI
jgi:hypothetical protein